MSDLDDIFDDGGKKKPIQSPIINEGELDLPTLSQEIEKRAKHRRILLGWFKFFGFLIVLGLMVALIGLVGAFLYCKPRYDLAQTFDLADLSKVEVATRIVDRNGKELGKIFVQNRQPIPIEEVSDHFIKALVAAEDGSFYTHDGVDYTGVLRAVYWNFKANSVTMGASTITQQLARNTFELRDRTVSRKVTEAFLARRIEKELGDKQRVLELYLNRIYFGSGYYGIEAAAEGYFGKPAKDLTIVEAATLAGVIRNPYYRSPRKYPAACKKTRDYVLELMKKEEYIDRETMERNQKSPIRVVDKASLTGKSGYVYEKVRQEVIQILGSEKVNSGGYVIETTIDSDLQTTANLAIQEQLDLIEEDARFTAERRADYKKTKRAFYDAKDSSAILAAPRYLQGAILMIDNETGSVLAQVGGRDFNDSMFDRTILGRYNTGTVFKPFIYAAAFEKGFFPGTLLNDSPINNKMVMVGGTTGVLGEWGTENPDNFYDGTITARDALIYGKNAATVRMGMRTGLASVVEVAERAGFKFKPEDRLNKSLMGRFPASISEMALAYSCFPNGGKRVPKTQLISVIRNSDAQIVHNFKINDVRDKDAIKVVDPYTAYQINDILKAAMTEGTGKKAKQKWGLQDFVVAGKTGTEYNYTDNWFAGYTTEVTCVGWIGFDNRKRILPEAFSSETILPAWTKVMNAARNITEPKDFRAPAGAQEEQICIKSGELACDECYETVVGEDGVSSQVRSTRLEFLRPGTNLSAVCHIHSQGGKIKGIRADMRDNKAKNPDRKFLTISTEPILPTAPTIIGNDPYGAIKPLVSTAAFTEKAVGTDPNKPELGKNGLPIARPDMNVNAFGSSSRVKLPRPRPIIFD